MEKINWAMIFMPLCLLCGVFGGSGFISLWVFLKDPTLIETGHSMLALWLSIGGCFFGGVFMALGIDMTNKR